MSLTIDPVISFGNLENHHSSHNSIGNKST